MDFRVKFFMIAEKLVLDDLIGIETGRIDERNQGLDLRKIQGESDEYKYGMRELEGKSKRPRNFFLFQNLLLSELSLAKEQVEEKNY